jgi:hypothetical protein
MRKQVRVDSVRLTVRTREQDRALLQFLLMTLGNYSKRCGFRIICVFEYGLVSEHLYATLSARSMKPSARASQKRDQTIQQVDQGPSRDVSKIGHPSLNALLTSLPKANRPRIRRAVWEHEPDFGPIGAKSELNCHGRRNGDPKRAHQVEPGYGVPPKWTGQARRWMARWMADARLVQNLGCLSEHVLGKLLNYAGIGDGDTTLQSFASFRRTKMPRRVRAASITSDPMPSDLEHTVMPRGLAFREEHAPKPIGPPIHSWSMMVTSNPR